MRLIDADALKKELINRWNVSDDVDFNNKEVWQALESAPTIEIVRCKECKHNPWDFDRTDFTCVWDDDFADRPQTPDDFCSYGEREGE